MKQTIENVTQALEYNAEDLATELNWFASIVARRFKLYFEQDSEVKHIDEIQPPNLSQSSSPYARCIQHYNLLTTERIALILALIPHLRPQLLDIFFTQNSVFSRPFTEFGGIVETPHTHFIPTLETFWFIVAGNDLKTRLQLQALFNSDHALIKHDILQLTSIQASTVKTVLQIAIHPDYLAYFTTGKRQRPRLSAEFPAQHIETDLSWRDLILHPGTRSDIEDISVWLQHGETLMHQWKLAGKLRPGYRALFYGPPGTGKTMTVCLLAKNTDREVYKIDLSAVVSKYIGETEKNLARVFDQAQAKGWILFFDEADALFGKRSETQHAHDRYANQEVSFLLQRIESFDGIIILASNLRENLDDAFMRRFESVIYFPIPRAEERLRLWQQGFSAHSILEDAIDLTQIAQQYSLSGGEIMNVIRYASLQSLARDENIIRHTDMLRGIRKEYAKEGKEG
jgi:hypothetical protein